MLHVSRRCFISIFIIFSVILKQLCFFLCFFSFDFLFYVTSTHYISVIFEVDMRALFLRKKSNEHNHTQRLILFCPMEQNDFLTYCGGEDRNSLLTVLNKNNEEDFSDNNISISEHIMPTKYYNVDDAITK